MSQHKIILSDNTKNVDYRRSDDSVHNQLSECSVSRLLHDPNICAVFFCLLGFFQHCLFPSILNNYILDSNLLENLSEILIFCLYKKH